MQIKVLEQSVANINIKMNQVDQPTITLAGVVRRIEMDIIFHDRQNIDETAESLLSVIRLFNEQYHIAYFREMHLSLTLVDDSGQDVELIDGETSEAYRRFEVYRKGCELARRDGRPMLKLVVDNSRSRS